MPVLNLNSFDLENPIIPGDITIGSGTSTQRDVPISFYYNYSYSGQFLTPTQLAGIPNGATITKIEWEYEILTNGTYEIVDVDMYMFQVDSTYTRFSTLQQQVNGFSTSDTAWNNAISNYIQIENDATISYVKVSADPNIQYRGFELTNSYTNYDNTKNLCIVFNSNDGAFQPGTFTYPRILTTFATNGNTYYANETDSAPYSDTSIVNYQLSYTPNIKIFYE
tara:strand:+ start:169 stop:837 length:669 start_codon:yes stop_codon:yes gene_type:complete